LFSHAVKLAAFFWSLFCNKVTHIDTYNVLKHNKENFSLSVGVYNDMGRCALFLRLRNNECHTLRRYPCTTLPNKYPNGCLPPGKQLNLFCTIEI
jgi:hypothetical protein